MLSGAILLDWSWKQVGDTTEAVSVVLKLLFPFIFDAVSVVLFPCSCSGNFVSVIEDLQNHNDRAVYKASTDILTSFFEPVGTFVLVCVVSIVSLTIARFRLKTTMMTLAVPQCDKCD
jgi:hypothetical protein